MLHWYYYIHMLIIYCNIVHDISIFLAIHVPCIKLAPTYFALDLYNVQSHLWILYRCLQHKDLLQLLIDASDSETKKGLETGEIVADSVGFMLAGYETTSTALIFATFLLAANPEAQERLANEIHGYFEENPVSD